MKKLTKAQWVAVSQLIKEAYTRYGQMDYGPTEWGERMHYGEELDDIIAERASDPDYGLLPKRA